MSYLLQSLATKQEVDSVIRNTCGKIVVLRFGKADDSVCMQLDDILLRTSRKLEKMACIFIVDINAVPIYTKYFDITIHPATLFFYNQQHMKCDYGTQDNTKFIGAFLDKQDFIDLVEIFYRGAIRGKTMVVSPLAQTHVPKYDLVYKNI